MNNLSFSYNDQRPILNHLSLKIGAGEKVCIKGGEGSGKSTFLKLLTGAYSDYEGNILVNDVPLGNYKPALLRSETGILFNRLEIFQGTLYENITLGDTNISTSQINALAARLGINEFIASLKKGFDTEIDAVGNRLSSAVIRKVLLLRALVSSPKLLLLEEPWLGLDPDCRRHIEQYLLQEIPATTVVVITNDDSFANRCNRIFYMHDGKVVREEQPISKQ